MSIEEANASGLPVAITTNENNFNPSSGEPYFFPNSFSSVASTTGGQWWPIVRPCSDPNLTQDMLDQICDDLDEGDNSIVLPPAGILSSDWDAQGRLLCNPGGASISEQLEDLITQIMSDSPIILVE